MATPISYPYFMRFQYTVVGLTHKFDAGMNALAGVSSDAFSTITLTTGASSGVNLATVVADFANAWKLLYYSTSELTVAELYQRNEVAPLTTPLSSLSIAQPGTATATDVLGNQSGFGTRKGNARGRVTLMETVLTTPSRNNPPTASGTDGLSLLWQLFNVKQYFVLRNGSWPDTAFPSSNQYNDRLCRTRGIAP